VGGGFGARVSTAFLLRDLKSTKVELQRKGLLVCKVFEMEVVARW
jgi:hypothetical protein